MQNYFFGGEENATDYRFIIFRLWYQLTNVSQNKK